MSGASDDWAYEHVGALSWTTEFWDIIFHAKGTTSPTDVWCVFGLCTVPLFLHVCWVF